MESGTRKESLIARERGLLSCGGYHIVILLYWVLSGLTVLYNYESVWEGEGKASGHRYLGDHSKTEGDTG